jgi:hypothetical protein
MKYGREVKIEKIKEGSGRVSTKNPHAVDNVNVAQGPRTGNNESTEKRSTFKAAKAEREPLATMIQDAYAKRQHEYEDYEYTNGGSIDDNVKARFKKSK